MAQGQSKAESTVGSLTSYSGFAPISMCSALLNFSFLSGRA